MPANSSAWSKPAPNSEASSRPDWAKKATGLCQTTVSIACAAKPACFIAATVSGTLSGSDFPQSAALFTIMRSVPFARRRATIRSSVILVSG